MRARALPVWAIGAAVAILAIAAPASRSGAAPASACTATSGVTVIVDFSYFHHDIERGCASGHPASALAALHAAGFGTAGTAQYGDAFVCRINNLPTPAKESCAQTPPANSSWAFYSARAADRDWTYTTTGVTTFLPPAGTIVAFAFGNYAKPGVRPNAAIGSPSTTTSPPAPPTTGAPLTAPVSPQSAPTTTLTPPISTTPPTTHPAATTTRTTSVARPARSVPATTSERAPRVVDRAAARTGSGGSSGSPLPAVLTIAIVAILGIGGLLAVNARRRSPS